MLRIVNFILATLAGLLLLAVLNLPNAFGTDSYAEQIGGVFLFFFFPWLFFLLLLYVIVSRVGFFRKAYDNNRIPGILAAMLIVLSLLPLTAFYDESQRFLIWDLMTYACFLLSLKFVLLIEKAVRT